MITIELNSVDISSQVIFDSLSVVQNLTNEVDTAQFSVRKYGARTIDPSFNDNIVIQDGSDKIFAGKIVEIEMENETSGGSLLTIKCVDHTLEFDRLLASKTYTGQTVKEIIDDLVSSYAPTFTTTSVTSSYVIPKIVFNQVPLSQCIRKLADIMRYDWYIDADKDIHFFEKFTNTAPFNLTDTSGNYEYQSLKRTADGSQIVNRVKVRGGEYDGDTFTDIITVSGNDSKSFKLPYRFANLTIELNTGAGYVSKTVGIDFIDDFTTKDVLHNFQDQSFKFENTLANGNKIRFSGNPKVPVLAIAEDSPSVIAYGAIEKLIRDNTIESNSVARKRASAELLAFADSVIDAKFQTISSGLRSGQLINVASTKRGIDDDLVIKRLTFQARTPFKFLYKVDCISTQRYTLLDVLRKIMSPDTKKNDEKEVAEQIFAVNETVTALDEVASVSPKDVDETVTVTESVLKDPVDPADIEWVYGFYCPTSQSDPKRMAKFDRDSVYM